MALAAQKNEFPVFDASMRGSFIAAGLFHLAVFLMTVVSLPFLISPPPDISTPISVEIVDISEITQTNKIAAPIEKPEEKPIEAPPPQLEIKPSPPPPQEEIPTPEPPKPVPLEKVKPPEEKVLQPAPKKPPVKTQEKKEEKKKDFNSLLKNLTPEAKKETKPQESLKDVLAAAEETQTAPLGERMTMSEIDALKHQLAGCWNVLSGAKYAENIIVEVRVVVNPDRTVQQATIINQPLYTQDGYYRAAADAAIRALHHPRCSPLALPAGKYNEWKTTVIKFDPREML
jgi:hypothetical protein